MLYFFTNQSRSFRNRSFSAKTSPTPLYACNIKSRSLYKKLYLKHIKRLGTRLIYFAFRKHIIAAVNKMNTILQSQTSSVLTFYSDCIAAYKALLSCIIKSALVKWDVTALDPSNSMNYLPLSQVGKHANTRSYGTSKICLVSASLRCHLQLCWWV